MEGRDWNMEDRNWKFPLNEKKRAGALAVISQEILKKQIRTYPSLLESIWNQLRFQSWRHWLLNGGILLFAMLFAVSLREKNLDDIKSVTSCSVFFVFAGNIGLSSIMRLFSWHMAELEQTLYLNLKQMVCIRMLETGVFDLIILLFFAGITGGGSEMGAAMYFLYMLVPFLWSDIMYLYMLVFLRNIIFTLRTFTLGVSCGVLALFPLLWKDVYEPEYKAIWLILLAAGILVLAAEVYHILVKIEGGDSVCLN